MNIHSRAESGSKKELSDRGDIAHFDAEYSGDILYKVEDDCKYSKANNAQTLKVNLRIYEGAKGVHNPQYE